MKKIEDILFIVQARLESERVPRKMVKPFAGTTLLDILIDKIKKSKIIPVNNFYLSVCDEELISIAKNHNINYYQRSKKSALSENDIPLIFEWHDQLPYKYVVLISACSPLLSIDTIDKFVKSYINSTEGGMFGVVSKKQYFWDCNFNLISPWPPEQKVMNTKTMGLTYEAAHCLYASRMDIIKDGYWMDPRTPPQPELFAMNELESLDIDYEWQFELVELMYKKLKHAECPNMWSGG